MTDKIDDIRKKLESGVSTDSQAKILAQAAAAAIAPEAMKMQRRLDEAFRAIPQADGLRGESEQARQTAIAALESAVADAKRSSKDHSNDG